MSSGKTDKNEFFTGEEILLSHQRRVIEKIFSGKFLYSSLGKAFGEQKQLIIKEKGEQKESKIMENNWLNLMNLIKIISISTKIANHLKNKKSNELEKNS